MKKFDILRLFMIVRNKMDRVGTARINIFGPSIIILLAAVVYFGYTFLPPYFVNYEAQKIIQEVALKLLKGKKKHVVVDKAVKKFKDIDICIGKRDIRIAWSRTYDAVEVWVPYGVYRPFLGTHKKVLVKFTPRAYKTLDDVKERF